MGKLKDRKKKLKILSANTNKMDKTCEVDQSDLRDRSEENEENHGRKKLTEKKRKNFQTTETESIERETKSDSVENGSGEQHGNVNEVPESTKRKPKKKKSKKDKKILGDEVYTEAESYHEEENGLTRGQSRKAKQKKNDYLQTEGENILKKRDSGEDEVHQISSGDEDCSKGMRKWIMEYHQQRPGLNVLQERIDDFIAAHEAKEEQEREERETRIAEDGWTVVTHHKGRKKTTDAETGIVVGAVNQAAVLDKMAKKKSKNVGIDFYRFQRREARKNEILLLQNKFEEDKKRIQQLRAARKFRPY